MFRANILKELINPCEAQQLNKKLVDKRERITQTHDLCKLVTGFRLVDIKSQNVPQSTPQSNPRYKFSCRCWDDWHFGVVKTNVDLGNITYVYLLILPSASCHQNQSKLVFSTTSSDSHFKSFITATTYNLISHKINAINLVCMSRQINFDFIRLQIPNLNHQKKSKTGWNIITKEKVTEPLECCPYSH